jgi:hypothetical protein
MAQTQAKETFVESIIESIDKGKSVIKIREIHYGKAHYIDVRDFIKGTNNTLYPSQRGVTIPVVHLAALIGALEKAETQITKGE